MNKIWWKKIHNWLGVSSALFLLILLVTGILLNHPSIIKNNATLAMAADPINSKKIFSGRADGLYYTMDSGKSWEEVPMLYPPMEVVDITYSPRNPKQLYLLEKWGRIYSSKDGGKIWSTIHPPFDPQIEGIELKKLSIGAKGKLVLLTSHGWLSSMDGGLIWDESHFNKKSKPLYRIILTLHNGYFFGPSFVWLYDFAAIALLVLIGTGFILWNIGRKIG